MGRRQPRQVPIPEAVAAWCRQWLDEEPRQVLFRVQHLSEVTGLRLASGRAVVVKARPPSERVCACVRVQRHLWRVGFACPGTWPGRMTCRPT